MSCPIFWIKNDAGKYLPTPFSVEPLYGVNSAGWILVGFNPEMPWYLIRPGYLALDLIRCLSVSAKFF